MNSTHCQICAREIKASTGRIAHHGYQRPGNGWQTASCDGARQLPYEVSRDFIPVVIERYKIHQKNQEDMADEMLRAPQETITRSIPNPYDRNKTTETEFTRPEGFDPYTVVNKRHQDFPYHSYENEFIKTYQLHRTYEKQIASEIEFLQTRWLTWKKVA